jgi:hypothetical protein
MVVDTENDSKAQQKYRCDCHKKFLMSSRGLGQVGAII